MKQLIISCFIALLSTSLFADDIGQLIKASDSFRRIADQAIPAVVHISTRKTVSPPRSQSPFMSSLFDQKDPYTLGSLGSGVIISKEGFILTNYHVIASVDSILVTLSTGEEFDAEVVGTDKKTDLALLKIKPGDYPTLSFGDSQSIRVGDWAIAVGSPFGLAGSMTVGIISAKGRSDHDIVDYSDLIQTDAAINPGNSGGALLNIQGDLIGINTAILTQSGGFNGIGFALPSNTVKRVMEDLIQFGSVQRGWFGGYVKPITPSIKETFQLTQDNGVFVSEVMPGSSAEQAGLQRGDVLISLHQTPISTPRDIPLILGKLKIGEKVSMAFIRNNETIDTTLTLLSAESTKKSPFRNKQLGFELSEINETLVETYALTRSRGLVITSVKSDSEAYEKGIRPGAIVKKIHRKPLRNLNDYEQLLKDLRKGETIQIVIQYPDLNPEIKLISVY